MDSLILLIPLVVSLVCADQSGHAHSVSHQATSGVYTPQLSPETEYQYSPSEYQQAEYSQATAYGNINYDPAASTAYGYSYDYPQDQLNELDEISDKQGLNNGITNPLAFVPFLASLSLPLGAAILTFLAIVGVSAAFFLFPSVVEVDVNSPVNRSIRSIQDNFNFGPCANSSSALCHIVNTLMVSVDCQEAASCEVASIVRSNRFPVMSRILEPFVSDRYYDRFANVDCSSLKCKFRKFY